MSASTPRGRFVWYDLMTSDTDAATSFYTKLVGWGTAQWEGGEQPYQMWTNQDAPLGGVMDLPDQAKEAGAPPHWIAYVAVPDTEASVAQASDLGGKVLVPATQIPSVGQFAVLQDPQGAVFAVYTPAADSPGHAGPANVGEFSWHELATTDHSAAFDFYSNLFGWEKTEAMDMGDAGTYQMYGEDGSGMSLGGIFNKPAEMPGPPAWLFYVKVNDVNQATDQVKEMGGQVLNGPMEVPGGDLVAQCMDPQGAAFALHSTPGK
jgi:predicted enzyme related to lactoylglutathione lyase